MSANFLRGATKCALAAGLVFGAGAVAQAQDEAQGAVIRIGKTDEGATTPKTLGDESQDIQQPAAPKYWIGLAGSAIPAEHVLRAHIDLPENQGLLVANVVPDSPAAKAGLKQHDILLRANDVELHEMSNLTDIVLAEGAKKGQIALEVLRKGQHETVYVTPEDRPANAPRPQLGNNEGFGGGFGAFGQEGVPGELLEQFRRRFPMEFRNFGPGVIIGGGQGAGDIPNGVSVSINKEDGKPTRVTVQRGDEKWEVVGDDPESLNKLPEDLRPFVEQMLKGGSPINFQTEGFDRDPMPEFGDGRIRERLERMEQRMQDIMKQLEKQHGSATNEAPKANETK